MIKWHFECTVCGSTTNEKTSGDWRSGWPKDLKDANKICPIQNKQCYYCDGIMEIIQYIDSTMGYIMCNPPTKNFDKLKPEHQKTKEDEGKTEIDHDMTEEEMKSKDEDKII